MRMLINVLHPRDAMIIEFVSFLIPSLFSIFYFFCLIPLFFCARQNNHDQCRTLFQPTSNIQKNPENTERATTESCTPHTVHIVNVFRISTLDQNILHPASALNHQKTPARQNFFPIHQLIQFCSHRTTDLFVLSAQSKNPTVLCLLD